MGTFMDSFNDTQHQVIQIHRDAPLKPALGAACNGCGVCCLAAPCPMGILVSRRRRGACRALQWQEAAGVYRCGMISAPQQILRTLHPSWRWLIAWAAVPVAWLARRWIAAGTGCDSSLEVAASSTMPASPNEKPTTSSTGHD